jgi:hypothetical protein
LTTVILLSNQLTEALFNADQIDPRVMPITRIGAAAVPGLITIAAVAAAAAAVMWNRRRGYARGYVDGAARRPAEDQPIAGWRRPRLRRVK